MSLDPDRPLLGLVLMVKNEGKSIDAMLRYAVPYVDFVTLLDTGSTDDTLERARPWLEKIPHEIHVEPFVDFATTRNRALELLGTRTVFSLMLSGDEHLIGGRALRQYAEKARAAAPGSYEVMIHFGGVVLPQHRLVRTGRGWHYRGVTHEVLVHASEPILPLRVPGAYVVHDRADKAPPIARWEQDRVLLEEECERRPDDTRSCFYLARTYDCLGLHSLALAEYQRRIALGGWREEIYEARCASVLLWEKLRAPWHVLQEKWLRVHEDFPHRAEPLYQVARHYPLRSPLCHLFARAAYAIPEPGWALFLDPKMYPYRIPRLYGEAAVYAGDWNGRKALREAMKAAPEEQERLRAVEKKYQSMTRIKRE